MFRRIWVCVIAAAGLGLAHAAARADVDILVRTDGSAIDGKVVSQDEKQVVFHPDGTESNVTLPRSAVTKIVTTDAHGALLKDSSVRTDAAKPTWDVPPLPKPPPIPKRKTDDGARYCLIPLHGEVGSTILAAALERGLDDAIARKPEVVVLDIDSPGGSVAEARRIIQTLRRYNKKVRIVALCGQDLSAAAIFTMSVREIYVKPGSTIGAATSFRVGPEGTPADVAEKFQSAWRAVARDSAEEGNHEPLLADAMIDASCELHLEKNGDKYRVKEGPGEIWLCRKGKILTLTSHEAVRCGLAANIAEDLAELGADLHMHNWTETPALATPLAEALVKRASVYDGAAQQIKARLAQHVQSAASSDPSDQVVTVTRVGPSYMPTAPMMVPGPPQIIPGPHGPIFLPSPPVMMPGPMHVGAAEQRTITQVRNKPAAQWKPDSLACLLALQQAEADVQEAVALSTAFDRTSEAELLKEIGGKLSGIRAEIFENRNKFGTGNAPRVVVVAAPQPRPATAPSRGAVRGAGEIPAPMHITINHLPDDRTPTAQVGGGGGAPFVTTRVERTAVVGFRYTMGSWGRECMRTFRPLYEPPADEPPQGAKDVLARDGYVVGGIKAVNDRTNVVAIKVVFMRKRGAALDPSDQYESDWIGDPKYASEPHTLACNGQLVVGVYGRQGLNLDAFGLIVWGKPVEPASK